MNYHYRLLLKASETIVNVVTATLTVVTVKRKTKCPELGKTLHNGNS